MVRRESVELAFVTALQILPANQRAVLLLRDVLAFSADDTATILGASLASVTSSLQRARRTVEQRLPDTTQRAVIERLGKEEIDRLVTRYIDAWERSDTEALVALLLRGCHVLDAAAPNVVQGPTDIARFLAAEPMRHPWRLIRADVGGHVAFACYTIDNDTGNWAAHSLDVLTLGDDGIEAIVGFLDASLVTRMGSPSTHRQTARATTQTASGPGVLATSFDRANEQIVGRQHPLPPRQQVRRSSAGISVDRTSRGYGRGDVVNAASLRMSEPRVPMEALRMTRCESVRLVPDPRRVITKPFLPARRSMPTARRGCGSCSSGSWRCRTRWSTRRSHYADGDCSPAGTATSTPCSTATSVVAARLGRPRPRRLVGIAESAPADRRLLHARVLDRGGRTRQPVDRRRARPVRRRRRARCAS